MGKEEKIQVKVTEVFYDKKGERCDRKDAVRVYVQITDSNGNYIDGRMIALTEKYT